MANCTRMIEVDKLAFADNVRTPECLQIPAMVESVRRHGFKNNHPLVVVEKKGDDNQITYLVLIGNRRGLGLLWLRDNDAEEYRRILPTGKVPAVVHKGLTAEEEVDLRIDHSPDEDRVPLDDWSVFLAIKQLVQVGLDTQERIATKLGLFIARGKKKGQPNRPFVQPRVNLARLPLFVQAEFEKLCREGKDSTPVRWANIPQLFKVFNTEFAEYPDGDGPEFQGVWQKALTPPEVKDEKDSNANDGSVEPKELTPAEAIKRSQAANSTGLRHALLAITRQSAYNLAEIDQKILAGESAIRDLAMIKAYLGEKKYASLILEATAKDWSDDLANDDDKNASWRRIGIGRDSTEGLAQVEEKYEHPETVVA